MESESLREARSHIETKALKSMCGNEERDKEKEIIENKRNTEKE